MGLGYILGHFYTNSSGHPAWASLISKSDPPLFLPRYRSISVKKKARLKERSWKMRNTGKRSCAQEPILQTRVTTPAL
jgi:hypothetical protein